MLHMAPTSQTLHDQSRTDSFPYRCECQAGRPFSCLDVDVSDCSLLHSCFILMTQEVSLWLTIEQTQVCTDYSCDIIAAAIPENDSIFLPDLVEISLAIAGCCRLPDILV